MAKYKSKLQIFAIFSFVIFLIFANFVIGGKQKRAKIQNILQFDELKEEKSEENNNIQCPEKEHTQSSSSNLNTTEDAVAFELMFKIMLILSDDAMTSPDNLEFQISSVLFYLEQKVAELFDYVTQLYVAEHKDNAEIVEFAEEIRTEWERVRTNSVGNKLKEDKDKVTICLIYELAMTIISTMMSYEQNGGKWLKFLKEKRIMEMIQLQQLNCASIDGIEQIFSELANPPKIHIINGQNIAQLLRMFAEFRHFFCIEVENMETIKARMIEKLVDSLEMIHLEEQFPEIMRIDLMMIPIINQRVRNLLVNRSDSLHNKQMFERWTMGFLVATLRDLEIGITINLASDEFSTKTLEIMDQQVREQLSLTYRNFDSARQKCILIRYLTFLSTCETKNIRKFEKTLKRWGPEINECSDCAVQEKVIRRFQENELGMIIHKSILHGMAYMREEFAKILQVPGARTRLLRAVSSKQRLNALLIKADCQEQMREVFTNNGRLWGHYEMAMEELESVWLRSRKLGADTVVFMRWLQRKLEALKQRPLLSRITEFVADDLYDPLFDEDEVGLEKSEQILAKVFIFTQKFVANIERNGVTKCAGNSNLFKKWKEIITENKKPDKKELEELKKWLAEMHKKQFEELLKNGRLENFITFLGARNGSKIREKLLHFFDANAISEIFREFGLNEELLSGQNTILRIEEVSYEEEESEFENSNIEENNEGGDEECDSSEEEPEKYYAKNVKKTKNNENLLAFEDIFNTMNKYNGDKDLLETPVNCQPKHVPIEILQAIDEVNNRNGEMAPIVLPLWINYLTSEKYHFHLIGDGTMVLLADMYSIIWYHFELISTVYNFLKHLVENGEAAGSPMSAAVQKLGTEWRDLLLGVIVTPPSDKSNSQSKRSVLFLLHKFIRHIVGNKVLRAEGPKWREYLKENAKYLDHFLEDGTEEVSDEWVKPEYEDEELIRIYSDSKESGRNMEMCFFAIAELIRKYRQIQRHFCELSTPEAISHTKTKIGNLIGLEHLVKLDEVFPEILHIDFPTLQMHYFLFKKLLSLKTGSRHAMNAEARLVLPLILQRLGRQIEPQRERDRLKPSKSAKIGEEIMEEFKRKFKRVKREIYAGIRTGRTNSNNSLLQSLCIAQYFANFVAKTLSSTGTARKAMRMGQILEWNGGEKCKKAEEQQNAYKQQRSELAGTHLMHLDKFLKNGIGEFKQILAKTRGARTRLRKLLGAAVYSVAMADYQSELRLKAHSFDCQKLADDFLATLFGADKTTRVCGKLSVFISVWVRWMDSELSAGDRTIGLKKVDQMVWKRSARASIEDFYDELVDEDLDGLEKKSNLLKELFLRMKAFVEAKRLERNLDKLDIRDIGTYNGRGQKVETIGIRYSNTKLELLTANNLKGEWEHMVEEARKRAEGGMQPTLGEVDDRGSESMQWFYRLRWEMFVVLLENNAEFREEVEHGLNKRHFGADENKVWQNAKEDESLRLILAELFGAEIANEFEKVLKSEENLQISPDKLMLIIEREDSRHFEEKKKKSEEERALADQSMTEMIKEEERLKELKRRMDQRQLEKRKKKAEQRKREKTKDNGKEEESAEKKRKEEESESSSFLFEEKEDERKLNKKDKSNRLIITKSEENTTTESEIPEDELTEEFSGKELINFISDKFLRENYAKFAENPSKSLRTMLNIGCYVNEIWHRIEQSAAENKKENEIKFEKIINGTKNCENIKNWNEFFDGLQRKLHEILKEITENSYDYDANSNLNEMKSVQNQMHRNKFAKTIIEWENENNNIWSKLGEKQQNVVLSALFGWKGTKTNLAKKFEGHFLAQWRAMAKQQIIDRLLYNQYAVDCETELIENKINFPEQTQQIYLKGSAADDKQEELLNKILEENGYSKHENAEAVLKSLKDIISKWSNGDARLLVTGSYLLGAHTSNSDIDTICVLPQKIGFIKEEREKFYGDYYCDLNAPLEQRLCEDNSLYCQFCKNPNVEELSKIPSSYIPFIGLRLFGIEFDISMVAIPGSEYLPDEPLDSVDVEWMMEMLSAVKQSSDAMLKSLSGFLANNQIIESLKSNKKNMAKFRSLVSTLKFWTKSNYVYGNIYGFFNGISLSVMAAKIILYYPNSSIPFLFEIFLLIFKSWHWPVPVKLVDRPACSSSIFDKFISWNLAGAQLIMPIIAPACLEQNSAQNINESTFKIIQNEMEQSHLKLTRILSTLGNDNGKSENEWQQMFPTEQFVEKYSHFVIISCIVSVKQHIDQFCGFVERRIRFGLLRIDQNMKDVVEYTHLKSGNNDRILPGGNKCPAIVDISEFARQPLCKIWLIGVKLKGNATDLCIEKLNANLEIEIEAKIFKEYQLKVLKGWYQHVKLKSKYVEKSELVEKWNETNEKGD